MRVQGSVVSYQIGDKEALPSPRRKMVRASSLDNTMFCSVRYSFSEEEPLPELANGGVRMQVSFAGACSTHTKQSKNLIRNQGLLDTSLFPGYEISGVVDEVCAEAVTDLKPGDRVVVYPDEDIGFSDGYSEFVTVKNLNNIIRIPNTLSLEVAALLPCGGLTAYSACMRAKSYIQLAQLERGHCNILVIGAGGLGLWASVIAKYLDQSHNNNKNENIQPIKCIVADTNPENLSLAKDHGCHGVIHWPSELYEEHVLDRTRCACPEGFDIVIDFVSSPRTVDRAIKVLNKGGVLIAGGNTHQSVLLNLGDLADNEQIIIGVRKGSRKQLAELVELVSSGEITPPKYTTYHLKDADQVFQGLSQCKIRGRAVLQVSATSI